MEIPYSRRYCVDMGVLIKFDYDFSRKVEAFKAIWEELDSMVTAGELFSCEFLEEEANRYYGTHAFIKDWIAERKNKLLIPNDPEIMIALGMIKGCTIITTESKAKPNKIPQVAFRYGVRSIDIYEFFDERGLKMIKVI